MGDKFSVNLNGQEVVIKICGVLKNGASCFGSDSYGKDNSIFDCYTTYDCTKDDTKLALFMKREYLENGLGVFGGFGAIKYKSDTSIIESKNNEQFVMMAQGIAVDGNDFHKKNTKIIKSKVGSYTDIGVGIIILLVVSLIAFTGIDVMESMRRYSVYYCCGMKRRHCIVLNLVQSFISLAMACMLIAGVMFLSKSGVNGLEFFNLGKNQLRFCGFAALFLIALSVIVPTVVILAKSPAAALKESEDI